MSMKTRAARLVSAALAAILALPLPAHAETVVQALAWSELEALPPGEALILDLADGSHLAGRLLRADAQAIELLDFSGSELSDKQQVKVARAFGKRPERSSFDLRGQGGRRVRFDAAAARRQVQRSRVAGQSHVRTRSEDGTIVAILLLGVLVAYKARQRLAWQ